MKIVIHLLDANDFISILGSFNWAVVPNENDYIILDNCEYCVVSRTFDYQKQEIILKVYKS